MDPQLYLRCPTSGNVEVQFRPGSYGFRPGRSCKDALREVDRLLKEGYTHVVDADLRDFYSIPHDRLMALVAGSISDGRVLSLIEGSSSRIS